MKTNKVFSVIEKLITNTLNILGIIPLLGVTLMSLFVLINSSRWYFSLDNTNNWNETTGFIKTAKVIQKLNPVATADMDDVLYEGQNEVKTPLLNKITNLFGYENSNLDYIIREEKDKERNMQLFDPSVKYSYSIDGVELVNSTISGNYKSYDNYEEASKFLQSNNFTNGFETKVYYLKSDPTKSVLQLNTHTSTKGIMIGSLLFVILFTTLLIIYIKKVVIKNVKK